MGRNGLLFFAILTVFLLNPPYSFAEESNTTTTEPTVAPTKTTTTKEAFEKMRMEKRQALENLRSEQKEKIQNLQEEMRAKREEAMERYKAQRALFEQKIQTIKDERRKEIVERVDSRILERNTKYTNRMSEILEKLKAILKRVSEKGAVLKSEGKDTSALDRAIASANTAISDAEAAVVAQAGKEYVITIGTETTLKTTVGSVVSTFRSDISAVHKTVIAAKQAVMKAAMELAKLRGEKVEEPTVTTTPSTGSATIVN